MLVDVHTNDIVVNLLVLGKTYRSSNQPLDVGAEVQVLTLDPPCTLLAHHVFDVLRRQPGIGTPFVCVDTPDGQVGHLPQQLLIALVGKSAIVVGYYPAPRLLPTKDQNSSTSQP